ncbi:MAG TPA: UDP-3-O-acyl-N-acetylglucosamine deacetylase [Fimbriimonadaceae bacterium]|nr:UDP-3-O-acyl-N-acetylglucosamine deacetylase [Fimbriimonadaceae bacterium]HRJ95481.1 UDP-3-O-acyl-N-acetylglucosamine deacetylase [Fimbriimonadaceae bacterium]
MSSVLRLRKTVAGTACFEGRGLHSGVPVRVEVHPGEHGIFFAIGPERIAARPDQVTDTWRCTRLGSISTIEHLMSALAGLGITDAEIELDASELPALDGSASRWCEGLLAQGLIDLPPDDITLPFARIFEKSDSGSIAISRGAGLWTYVFDGGERFPERQEFVFDVSRDDYASQVAPARTLVFEDEVAAARAAGLGGGLDESSVLVLGSTGYVNPARFPDEPARHKLLDLMGDLYLAGVPIGLLNVSAERSGHRLNVGAARRLYEACWSGRRDSNPQP